MLCPQGTPIFTARAVVSCKQRRGKYILEPMPQLDQENGAYKAYDAAIPDRLRAFPPNKEERYEIPIDKEINPFKHKLQYDAESVFWLLLYWAIRACPVENTSPASKKIAKRYWGPLTDTQDEAWDPREAFLGQNFPSGAVHPVYQPLELLLENMAQQLRGDHEQVPDDSRKKDDYLHEVFQRLILNFLFTHDGNLFMTEQKGPDPRKPVEEPGMKALMSEAQVSKIRNSAAASSRGVPSESAPSGTSRSAPSGTSRSSLKRKREGGAASDGGSDPKDGDYSDPKDGDYSDSKDSHPVSTVSCVSSLLFTSRLYTETSQMILTVMGKRYRNPFDRFI
jgi:hypothetical protein